VTHDEKILVGENLDEIGAAQKQTEVTPKELTNYYTCVKAEKKLLALVKFLCQEAPDSKILVFLCSAASVEYLDNILSPFLTKKGLCVLALHRKKIYKRTKILDEFRKSKNCILLSTDLMARGVDVVDIDWVAQFDIPRQSSLFIHRSGRSGRNGREGRSLVFLMREERAYVDFVQKHEKIKLTEWKIKGANNTTLAEKLREKVQNLAISDRRILENGSRTFVSYVQAYCKHDCQIVCQLKDLDIPGIAHSFGLLRMPQMKELKRRSDLSKFKARTDVQTQMIAYKNPKLEEARQATRAKKASGKTETLKDESLKEGMEDNKESPEREEPKRKRKKLSEWDELQQDERLLKKFKKGKLSKKQLEEMLSA